VTDTERTSGEPVERADTGGRIDPIERPSREPIELAEASRGTHLMDVVRVPDGFIAPSAALTPVTAQSVAPPIGGGQDSVGAANGSPDPQSAE
jgi:hypothetical protein